MKYLVVILKMAVLAGLILLQFEELDYLKSVFGKAGFYIGVVLRLFIFLLGFDLLRGSLIRLYRRRVRSANKQDNFLLGINHIYNLLVILGIFFTILAFFRVDVKQLFTSLSIIAAALAIIFKDYISNMLNGMIITFSDHLSLGDYVKIGEHKGKIIDINLLNVHLLNDDDDLIFIPNSNVLATSILNYTKRETKKNSVDFAANLKQLTSVSGLEQDLIAAMGDLQDQVLSDSYNLKIVDLEKDYAQMKFQYILKDQDKQVEKEIKRRVLRKVVDLMRENKTSDAKISPN